MTVGKYGGGKGREIEKIGRGCTNDLHIKAETLIDEEKSFCINMKHIFI